MHQDIGILGNNAEPLYMSLSNANAAVTDVWTEWPIDLQLFIDQGVNLADVDKITIGLRATGDPAALGGSGTVFVDDITLIQPAVEEAAGN